MLTFAFLLTQAFAIDFRLEPQPDFTPRQYVEFVLNHIGYDQARPDGNGRIVVTGPVDLDLRPLAPDVINGVRFEFALLQAGLHDTLQHFDLSRANLRFDDGSVSSGESTGNFKLMGPTTVGKSAYVGGNNPAGPDAQLDLFGKGARPRIFVIDEAQNLPSEVMERINWTRTHHAVDVCPEALLPRFSRWLK